MIASKCKEIVITSLQQTVPTRRSAHGREPRPAPRASSARTRPTGCPRSLTRTPLPAHSAQPRRRLCGLQGRVNTWHHQLARVHRGVPLSSALHTLTNLELPTSRPLSSPSSSTALCRSWAILFSHPNDFMPVCTTELGSVESLKDEFQRRGVKVAALSCNDVESHGVCQPVELGGWDGGGGPRLGRQLTPWPAVAQRRGSRTLWRSTNAKGPGFTSRLSPTRRGPSRTRWA